MAKDFFDEDLATPPTTGRSAGEPAGAGSYFSQQKRQLPEQVSQASDEIERLRQRQDEIERRKQALIEQRRRIEAYEHGRHDLLDKLGRSAVLVVREGEQASRMAALCGETGSLFQGLHQELESIAPEKWSEADYDRELTRALAQVDSASQAYRKAMDRLNASAWHRGNQESAAGELAGAGLQTGTAAPQTFTRWLIAGFAFSLPVILILVALFAIYLLAVVRPPL